MHVAWIWQTIGGPLATATFDHVAITGTGLLAGAACLVRARLTRRRTRAAWSLLGAGMLLWQGGEAYFGTVTVVLRHRAALPLQGVIVDMVGIALVGGGLVLLGPSWQLARRMQLRVVADALMISTSLSLVGWASLIGPALRAGNIGLAQEFLTLASPLGDILLITLGMLVIARLSLTDRWAPRLLVLGFACTAAIDFVFASRTLVAGYPLSTPADGLWVAGHLLVLLAAVAAPRRPLEPAPLQPSAGFATAFLPYVPFGLVVVWSVVDSLRHGRGFNPEPVTVFLTRVVALLLIARQLLMVIENVKLTRETLRDSDLLRQSEEHFRSLIRNSPDAIAVLDGSGNLAYRAPTFERIFGVARSQTGPLPFISLVHQDDVDQVTGMIAEAMLKPGIAQKVDCRIRQLNGEFAPTELTVTNLLEDPSVGGLVVNSRDLSERKLLETRLLELALHDPLTGLANRRLFSERLDVVMAPRSRRPASLLSIDIDDFKVFNDTWGHPYGDAVLVEVARRLEAAVRPGDLVARLGGDEFSVLLEAGEAEAAQVTGRIRAVMAIPFAHDGHEQVIGISIGLATRDGIGDQDEIFRRADRALYAAKTVGGSNSPPPQLAALAPEHGLEP